MSTRAYYQANRAAIIARNVAWTKTPEGMASRKAYYAKTIERRREIDRARYRRHKAKRLAAMKDYRHRNAAKIKVQKAAKWQFYWATNKEALLERNRRDRQKHRAKRNATQRQWQRANRDKCRTYETRYMAKKPWLRSVKNGRRRKHVLLARTDTAAEVFIKRVRSMKRIQCYYCGKWMSGRAAHIDHVQALSKSLNHASDNLCAACEFCNCSKCDRSLREWLPPTQQPLLEL